METEIILDTLKNELKARKITYKNVAESIGLSEASVKRMFHLGDMPLSRLEEVAKIIDMSIFDLIQAQVSKDSYISELTLEQETLLVKEPKVLLILFLLLNGWRLQEIEENFNITNPEMIKSLSQLDRFKLIRLLPLNRVRLLTTRNFRWKKNGPVQKLFEDEVLSDFINSKFGQEYEDLSFAGGTLSAKSFQIIKDRIKELVKLFDELCYQDSKIPLKDRESYGAIFAIRQWQYSGFEKMRRR